MKFTMAFLLDEQRRNPHLTGSNKDLFRSEAEFEKQKEGIDFTIDISKQQHYKTCSGDYTKFNHDLDRIKSNVDSRRIFPVLLSADPTGERQSEWGMMLDKFGTRTLNHKNQAFNQYSFRNYS